MKRLLVTVMMVTLTLSLAACAGRTAAWDAQGEWSAPDVTLLNEAKLLVSEGDSFWQRRDDARSVEDALVRWEQAVAIDPTDHSVYERKSRAHAYLATHHHGEDVEAKVAAMDDGARAAELALMVISPEFGERMQRGAKLPEAIDLLGTEAATALYWYGVNLSGWSEHQPRMVRGRYADHEELIMRHLLDVAPGVEHAAPHRWFAGLHQERDDLEAVREHLGSAVELAPDYLLNRLLLARNVAVPMRDRTLFEAQMQQILTVREDALPGAALENARAKRLGRELLARMDELFPPAPREVEEAATEEVEPAWPAMEAAQDSDVPEKDEDAGVESPEKSQEFMGSGKRSPFAPMEPTETGE